MKLGNSWQESLEKQIWMANNSTHSSGSFKNPSDCCLVSTDLAFISEEPSEMNIIHHKNYEPEKLSSIRKIVSFKEVKTLRINECKQPTATMTHSPKPNSDINIIRSQINQNSIGTKEKRDSNAKESLLSKQLSLRRTRFVNNYASKDKNNNNNNSNELNLSSTSQFNSNPVANNHTSSSTSMVISKSLHQEHSMTMSQYTKFTKNIYADNHFSPPNQPSAAIVKLNNSNSNLSINAHNTSSIGNTTHIANVKSSSRTSNLTPFTGSATPLPNQPLNANNKPILLSNLSNNSVNKSSEQRMKSSKLGRSATMKYTRSHFDTSSNINTGLANNVNMKKLNIDSVQTSRSSKELKSKFTREKSNLSNYFTMLASNSMNNNNNTTLNNSNNDINNTFNSANSNINSFLASSNFISTANINNNQSNKSSNSTKKAQQHVISLRNNVSNTLNDSNQTLYMNSSNAANNNNNLSTTNNNIKQSVSLDNVLNNLDFLLSVDAYSSSNHTSNKYPLNARNNNANNAQLNFKRLELLNHQQQQQFSNKIGLFGKSKHFINENGVASNPSDILKETQRHNDQNSQEDVYNNIASEPNVKPNATSKYDETKHDNERNDQSTDETIIRVGNEMSNQNNNETQLQQQTAASSIRKKRESFSKIKSLTDINNRQSLNENVENELVEIVELNSRYANQNQNNGIANNSSNNNNNHNNSERYETNKKANLMLSSLKLNNNNNNTNANSKFLLQLSQNNLIAINSRESNNLSTNRLNHLAEQNENTTSQQQQVVSNTSRNKTGKMLNRSISRVSHVTRDPNDSYAYTNVQQYIEENDLMPPEKADSIRKWIGKVNSCFEDWEKRVVEINIDSS